MPKDPPSDLAKIRVKIGAHEFEAEGPHAVISTYFGAWHQLVATDPLFGPRPVAAAAAAPPADPPPETLDLFAVDLHRKLVTLRQLPDSTVPQADVALLLLYGFQRSLGVGHAVSVSRLKTALAAAGYPDTRIDRTLAHHVGAGLISKRGQRIGSTYHLSSSGFQRADALAHRLSAKRQPPV